MAACAVKPIKIDKGVQDAAGKQRNDVVLARSIDPIIGGIFALKCRKYGHMWSVSSKRNLTLLNIFTGLQWFNLLLC